MISSIVNKLAKERGMDTRVVDVIVGYPIKFFKEKCASNDTRPVMIRYFGKFVQKCGKSKERLCKMHIATTLKIQPELEEELQRLLEEKNYIEIKKLYDIAKRNNYRNKSLSN
jgi:molybdopterin converting factor small subunit